ncbi:Oidioi.mRNA.OKI2018_I69.chr1.g145.t1.cds [Oikopleura dioica]|uniref:Oidioi.mRNA.OKI2018_I69.chr1.g145.t1.cds n=1 Tax=Oikopleura dioica TaxID=34765 RepID=A0ABN7SIY6_OIKDI|nr:Oidioi.mRNA.OKI2018_I69.chr1.g145.t1.cds [Oikopleura dioica]
MNTHPNTCGREFESDLDTSRKASIVQYVHFDVVTPSVFFGKYNKLKTCYSSLTYCWRPIMLNYSVGVTIFICATLALTTLLMVCNILTGETGLLCGFIFEIFIGVNASILCAFGWKYSFGDCEVAMMIDTYEGTI